MAAENATTADDYYAAEEVDISSSGGGSSSSGGADGDDADSSAAVLRFVNEWLGAVSGATVGLLLAQVATIPVLTTVGCAQLLTDLDYLK